MRCVGQGMDAFVNPSPALPLVAAVVQFCAQQKTSQHCQAWLCMLHNTPNTPLCSQSAYAAPSVMYPRLATNINGRVSRLRSSSSTSSSICMGAGCSAWRVLVLSTTLQSLRAPHEAQSSKPNSWVAAYALLLGQTRTHSLATCC